MNFLRVCKECQYYIAVLTYLSQERPVYRRCFNVLFIFVPQIGLLMNLNQSFSTVVSYLRKRVTEM